MNRLSHQPKALVLAIALALGFATIGAGCTPGNQDDNAATPATPATVPHRDMTPNNAANGSNGTADNNGNNEGMSAGVGDSTQPVSDTWISTKVHAKLNTIGGMDNSDVEVETNNGVVVLTGRMASQSQVDKAVAALKTIKGVKKVDTSRLKIGPDTNQ